MVDDLNPKRFKPEPKEKAVPALTGKGSEKVQAMLVTIQNAILGDIIPQLLQEYPDVPKIFETARAKQLAELQGAQAELEMATASGLGKAAQLLSVGKQALSAFKDIVDKVAANVSELQELGVEPVL